MTGKRTAFLMMTWTREADKVLEDMYHRGSSSLEMGERLGVIAK